MVATTIKKTILEEIGTRTQKPSFLSLVDQLSRSANDTIRNLRLKVHNYGGPISDSLPDNVSEDSYFAGHVEAVVRNYLESTNADRILELPFDFRASRDPIQRNITTSPHLIRIWEREHYNTVDRINDAFDELKRKVEYFFTKESLTLQSDLKRSGITLEQNLDLNLDGDLDRALTRHKSVVYKEACVMEDPEELYKLSFNEIVESRGWEELDNEELYQILLKEDVPLDLFELYTGKRIVSPLKLNPDSKHEELSTDISGLIASENLIIHQVPEENYITGGYGAGLDVLREQCSLDENSAQPYVERDGNRIIRPLTPRESLLARIIDYNKNHDDSGHERTIDDRLRLFKKGFWTSAGMAYPYDGNTHLPNVNDREAKQPTKAKIEPVCYALLDLKPEDRVEYLEVVYDNINAPEIDLTSGIWNERLSRTQVDSHAGWINLVGDDEDGREILNDYASIVFKEVKRLYSEDKAMGFWKLNSVKTSQVRVPWIGNLGYRFDADGGSGLNYYAAFLRVSHAA